MGWSKKIKKIKKQANKAYDETLGGQIRDKSNLSLFKEYGDDYMEGKEKEEAAKRRRKANRANQPDYGATVITDSPELDDARRRLMIERRMAQKPQRGRSGTVLSGGSNKIG